jgi:chromosomal replication initiator protein
MLICRDALELSYPEIGKAFGNRDHTTAMSGVAKARSKLERETIWRDDLRAIHGSIIGPKKAQEVRYRVAV